MDIRYAPITKKIGNSRKEKNNGFANKIPIKTKIVKIWSDSGQNFEIKFGKNLMAISILDL